MNGFFCTKHQIHTQTPNAVPKWKPWLNIPSTDFLHNQYNSQCIKLERYTSSKFGSEKHFITSNDFVFINEGIIYNLNELLSKDKSNSIAELIQKSIQNNDQTFFQNFEGNFCGLLYQHHTKTLTVFNNQTAQKKIYYYNNDSLFACATDLKVLCNYLLDLNTKLTINERSAYHLLTSGFMHGNDTLIDDIRQIGAGEYLTLTDDQCSVKSYFNLNTIAENTDSKDDIIRNLDKLFRRAIKLEFDIDQKHHLQALTTLSGGLDSRMTALVAHKMGYDDQQLFGLSQKGYADEFIAQKIASNYHLKFNAYHLSSEILIPIEEVVAVNDGQVLYSMCSHFYSVIRQINPRNHGIVHTGLLGDAVMGSYVSGISKQMCKINSGLYSTRLLNKVEEHIQTNMHLYSCDEHYKFYNRGFNGINSSFGYFDLIGETSSPFLNPAFLKYAHSIPRKYKYKEAIYIDWIRTMYPDIADFVWENIGCKPTNNDFIRKIARLKRAVIKRLPLQSQWKHNMTPEQMWYDHNPTVKLVLDNYYEQNIGMIPISESLRQDMRHLYKVGNYTEKSQVLTVLSAHKLLINHQ